MYAENANGQLKDKNLQPTLYNSKELYSKNFDGLLQLNENPISKLSNNIQEDIKAQLTKLLTELLDPEQPFDQREDEKGCEYCGYAGICGR